MSGVYRGDGPESVMARNFEVVVKVEVRDLTDDEVADLHKDTLAFLTMFDLCENGKVESVSEVTAADTPSEDSASPSDGMPADAAERVRGFLRAGQSAMAIHTAAQVLKDWPAARAYVEAQPEWKALQS